VTATVTSKPENVSYCINSIFSYVGFANYKMVIFVESKTFAFTNLARG